MQVHSHFQPLQWIFRECEPKELGNSARVCRLWNQLISDENFNLYRLFRDFPIKAIVGMDFIGTNRQMYLYLQRMHLNIRKGRCTQTSSRSFKINNSPLFDKEITPDSKRRVTLDRLANHISVTVLDDSQTPLSMNGHNTQIVGVRILNDQIAVSASIDRVIKIWNLVTGECELERECERTFEGSNEELIGLEVIHQQGIIVTAFTEGTITLWSNQLEPVQVLHTCLSTLTSMVVSPDQNTMIVSGSSEKFSDSYLLFWDVHVWKHIRTNYFSEGISHHEHEESSLETTYYSRIKKARFSDDGSKIFLLASQFMVTLDFT